MELAPDVTGSLPFFKIFGIVYIMRIDINPRGNGACPLCAVNGKCRIQDTLTKHLAIFAKENDPMDLVIYSCPQFEEKS